MTKVTRLTIDSGRGVRPGELARCDGCSTLGAPGICAACGPKVGISESPAALSPSRFSCGYEANAITEPPFETPALQSDADLTGDAAKIRVFLLMGLQLGSMAAASILALVSIRMSGRLELAGLVASATFIILLACRALWAAVDGYRTGTSPGLHQSTSCPVVGLPAHVGPESQNVITSRSSLMLRRQSEIP
jgi:hypothetical protein